MDKSNFWNHIESSKNESGGDIDRQVEILGERLGSLPTEEIVSFNTIFNEFYFQSNTWNLWAAAYIINEGCSDDWFDYFRAGLISQGEAVFTEATRNPENLVNYITFENGDLSGESQWAAGVEEIMYVARDAYEAVTGTDEIPSALPQQTSTTGEHWEEENVELVLPKLAEFCRRERADL